MQTVRMEDLRKMTGYQNLGLVLRRAHFASKQTKRESRGQVEREIDALKERILAAEPGASVEFRHKDWPDSVTLIPDEMLRYTHNQQRSAIRQTVLYIPDVAAQELIHYFQAEGKAQPPLPRPVRRDIRSETAINMLQSFHVPSEVYGKTPPVPVIRILHEGKVEPKTVAVTMRGLRDAAAQAGDASHFTFGGLTLRTTEFMDVNHTLWVAGESADALAQRFAPNASLSELEARHGVHAAIAGLQNQQGKS